LQAYYGIVPRISCKASLTWAPTRTGNQRGDVPGSGQSKLISHGYGYVVPVLSLPLAAKLHGTENFAH